MNVNDIYPSKYVKAHDLGDKLVTVIIKSAVMESLGYGKEAERKLVIYFERATKGLILNRTNAMIIASLYSPETDNWIGKAIILYSARIKAFGAWAEAVRVKETIPARNVGAAQIPAAMQEAPPLDDDEDVADFEENADSPRVDPETGEILDGKVDNPFDDEPHESPPHQRLWGIGLSTFGPDWDAGARAWIIRNWTAHIAKSEVRDSAAKLNDTEKDLLGDYIRANTGTMQKKWKSFKASEQPVAA